MQVLEQMGSDANCQNEGSIETLLVAAELDTEITEAISTKDITSLGIHMDVRLDIVCAIGTPGDEDEDEDEDEDSTEETNNRVMGF
jgi:hypothetical protein